MSKPNFILKKHARSLPRSKKKMNVYRLALATNDVRMAEELCNAFLEMTNGNPDGWEKTRHHLVEAFVGSIVTSYARPFQNHRTRPWKLPSAWGEFSTQALQETHDYMLKLRDEVYAHSDPENHPLKVLPAACFTKPIGGEMPRIGYHFGSTGIRAISVFNFRVTCRDLGQRLAKAVFEGLDDLYEGMELPTKAFPFKFDEGL